MANIIVTYKDTDEKLVRNETIKKEIFEFSENTTFQNLFDVLEIDNVLSDNLWAIQHVHSGDELELVLKYVFHDGKVQWNYPLRECIIKDYLNTYRVTEIVLYKHKAIGGLVDPAIIWKVIIYLIKNGEEWLIGKAFEAAFNKIIEGINEKFLYSNTGFVSKDSVIQAIKRKDFWALQEFKFEFDLYDFEELAKVLLNLAGYVYSSGYDLYFFNKSLSEKNEKLLEDAVEKYIASK